MWLSWIPTFLENLAANYVAGAFGPTSMVSISIALAVVIWAVISWHRRQRAAKKPGMASWQFIALAFAVALLAVAAGAYGLGLRAVSTKQEVATAPASHPPATPAPQTPEARIKQKVAALTPQDKGRLSDRISALAYALDKAPRDDMAKARNFSEPNYRGTPPDPASYVATLTTIASATATYKAAIYDIINDSYFREFLTFIVPDASDSSPFGKLNLAARRYKNFIEIWSRIPAATTNEAFVSLLDYPEAEFEVAAQQFDQYVAQCHQRLSLVQAALL